MLKGILLTSGLAITTLFSHSASSHSSAAPAQVNVQNLSKWQEVKAEVKGENNKKATKQNEHQKLLKLVEKYSPDSLEKWKQAISERKDLLTQLKSEDVKQARKENRQSLKKELKEKIKSGELTKKEAIQQFRDKFQQAKENHKQNTDAKKELKAELKAAIQKKDSAQINAILDKSYQHFVSKNEALSQKLDSWKTNSSSSNADNTQNSL